MSKTDANAKSSQVEGLTADDYTLFLLVTRSLNRIDTDMKSTGAAIIELSAKSKSGDVDPKVITQLFGSSINKYAAIAASAAETLTLIRQILIMRSAVKDNK